MRIRISEADWNPVCDALFRRKDVESAALLLGVATATPSGTVISIRETQIIDDDAYLERRIDQISIDPVLLNKHLHYARRNNYSVITVHTHPGARTPSFSRADDAGDSKLMPSLSCQIPDAPHGSMVLTENREVVARVFDGDCISRPAAFHVVGKHLSVFTTNKPQEEQWFKRQTLALGADGQMKLAKMRVGIVGLGGTGSIASMQLSHIGVGELVLIDGDTVEPSNVPRVVGSTRDCASDVMKVDIAERYANSVKLVNSVVTKPEYLTEQQEAMFASCDVVLSCVDKQTPRALMNRWSYRHLVPVIDMGTAFRVNKMGSLTGDAGRVVVVGPGRNCLGCWGLLDADELRNEALSAEEYQKLSDSGYIDGANVKQPSVICFNSMVASASVTELLRLVTDFSNPAEPPDHLAFNFSNGATKKCSLNQTQCCAICG